MIRLNTRYPLSNYVVSFLGFKSLYDDMERDPLCHVADSDCLSLGDSSLLTPIDRLYSMQDSYFTSWGWRSNTTWTGSVKVALRRGVCLSLCTSLWSHVWTLHKEVGIKIPLGDMGTLWYDAIYHVHLHINMNTLLPSVVSPYLLLYKPTVQHRLFKVSCVCMILSDLSHYVWMFDQENITASTNVNSSLGVYLYLFSKCVYAARLESMMINK